MANEIEKIKVELPDAELVALADRIVQVVVPLASMKR